MNSKEPTRTHLLKESPKKVGCPLFALAVVLGLLVTGLVIW